MSVFHAHSDSQCGEHLRSVFAKVPLAAPWRPYVRNSGCPVLETTPAATVVRAPVSPLMGDCT